MCQYCHNSVCMIAARGMCSIVAVPYTAVVLLCKDSHVRSVYLDTQTSQDIGPDHARGLLERQCLAFLDELHDIWQLLVKNT